MADTTRVITNRYDVADYIDVGPKGTPNILVMDVFTEINENPNAKTSEKHYTADKSSTKQTTGYATTFPITSDMYSNEPVAEFLRDIAEEQKVGAACETDYFRVRLYEPVNGQEHTYYARKFRVSVEVSSISGVPGDTMQLSGNLNAIGDAVIGTFNTSTKTFTAKTAGA